MGTGWAILLGLAIGVAAMMPLLRLLLRRAEHRARDAVRRAHEAERLAELGSMTGGLAHEIKNPLSTVGLNAQLLAEGVRDSNLEPAEKQRLIKRLDALSREVERLGGILSDFLQFAGRMKLDPQRRDLGELVDQLSDFFHPQCDQARVVLRTQSPSKPVFARVDEGLFKQALLNLMINALQAMSPVDERSDNADDAAASAGELMLRVAADHDKALVHVIDTGPGFDANTAAEIFRPYVSRKRGGTGLGLPTARRIIEEHGGHITAHSEPGRGSEFVIELPLDTSISHTASSSAR